MQYWDYLRRQLYVLDTYSSAHNRRLNHLMALVQCGVGLALAAALLLATATTSALLFSWAAAVALRAMASWAGSGGWLAEVAMGGQRLVRVREAATGASDEILHVPAAAVHTAESGAAGLPALPPASVALLLCLAAATCALRYMVRQAGLLLQHLHPADARLVGELQCFNCAKLGLGLLAEGLVSPVCMLYTFCSPHITWAGIRYAKRGGRVSRVGAAVGGRWKGHWGEWKEMPEMPRSDPAAG
jgi:hypothetical protein